MKKKMLSLSLKQLAPLLVCCWGIPAKGNVVEEVELSGMIATKRQKFKSKPELPVVKF